MTETAETTPNAERIDWIVGQITDRALHPRRDGEWAGRAPLIADICAKYRIRKIVAVGLLKSAVAQLWDERPDGSADVERRLVIRRLEGVRALIYKAIEKPKVVTTYHFVKVKFGDGTTPMDDAGRPVMQRRKKSQTVTRQIEPGMITLLIAMERLIIELHQLDQTTEARDLAGQMIRQLTEKFQKSGGVSVSVRDAARQIDMKTLPARTAKAITSAVRAEARVKATAKPAASALPDEAQK